MRNIKVSNMFQPNINLLATNGMRILVVSTWAFFQCCGISILCGGDLWNISQILLCFKFGQRVDMDIFKRTNRQIETWRIAWRFSVNIYYIWLKHNMFEQSCLVYTLLLTVSRMCRAYETKLEVGWNEQLVWEYGARWRGRWRRLMSKYLQTQYWCSKSTSCSCYYRKLRPSWNLHHCYWSNRNINQKDWFMIESEATHQGFSRDEWVTLTRS